MTGPRSGPRQSLSYYLSVITRIRNPVLREQLEPTACPVAERMSWAAHRKTTRIEDQAYCLLGIFNVSIPLIYGEGGHAFQRLQEEIMKTTEEYSLFVSRLSGPRALSSGARAAQKKNPQVPHASKSLLNNLANNAAIVPQGLFAASALDFDVRLRAPDGEHLSSLELADSYLAVGKAGLGEDTPTMTGRGLRVRLFIFETKGSGRAGREQDARPDMAGIPELQARREAHMRRTAPRAVRKNGVHSGPDIGHRTPVSSSRRSTWTSLFPPPSTSSRPGNCLGRSFRASASIPAAILLWPCI